MSFGEPMTARGTRSGAASEPFAPDGSGWAERPTGPHDGDGAVGRDVVTRTLPPQSRSATEARGFVTKTLGDWGLVELCDDAELVVCELVTNALRAVCGRVVGHEVAGTADPARLDAGQVRHQPVHVKLVRKGWYVMCLVADPSDEAPVPQEPEGDPEFLGNAGRGLYLVEAYCRRWGWARQRDGGKVVWALLHAPD